MSIITVSRRLPNWLEKEKQLPPTSGVWHHRSVFRFLVRQRTGTNGRGKSPPSCLFSSVQRRTKQTQIASVYSQSNKLSKCICQHINTLTHTRSVLIRTERRLLWNIFTSQQHRRLPSEFWRCSFSLCGGWCCSEADLGSVFSVFPL